MKISDNERAILVMALKDAAAYQLDIEESTEEPSIKDYASERRDLYTQMWKKLTRL